MPYAEVLLKYVTESLATVFLRDYMGYEQKASDQSTIVVLHEDGEIHEINTSNDNDKDKEMTFGEMATDRDFPTLINIYDATTKKMTSYKYVVPTNMSYKCVMFKHSEKYAKAKLVASRFSVIYNDSKGSEVFTLMRMQSSDTMPRFVVYYDDACFSRNQAEQIIKKVLT